MKPVIPLEALYGRADVTVAPTAADMAYAAGFFDGEGNVTISAHHTCGNARGVVYNMRVGASQNDIAPLVWLRDRWGGSIRPMKRRTTSGTITHQWWCFSRMAAKFLGDIRPFLIVKAERADLAVAFQSKIFNPGAGGHSAEHRASMLALRHQMLDLNAGRCPSTSREREAAL